MEKRECPARNGLIVNTSTLNCPSSCDECPEYQLIRKERRYRESQERKSKQQPLICFYPGERKAFAAGSIKLTLQIHNFLKDFINKHDEEKIKHWYWAYCDMKDYLSKITLLKKYEDFYVESIYNLSALISRHAKQKKNIPLDCFLYGLRRANIDKNVINEINEALRDIDGVYEKHIKDGHSQEDAERFYREQLNDINKKLTGRYFDLCKLADLLREHGIADFKNTDTLKDRIYKANNTKHIEDIYDLAYRLVIF